LINGDFEPVGTSWRTPWSWGVSSSAASTISQDSTTAGSGQSSARVVVTTPAPDAPWNINLQQQTQTGGATISLVAGHTYTLFFWAKASAGQSVQAAVQQSISPGTVRGSQWYILSGSWQSYTLTFTAPVSETAVKVQFNFGKAAGTVWLDGVSLQEGDPNLWRRDFTNGTLLLNATNTAQTVMLGAGYRHILGTQNPTTNNGATVSSVTVPPQDAVLLVKTP